MVDTQITPLKCGDIFRIVAALLAEELQVQTGQKTSLADIQTWCLETPIDEDGIGFDSLARIDFAVRLNKYFHLHDVGSEDYLLLKKTLGEWCEVIEFSLSKKFEHITFQTSGSTGTPKPCTHMIPNLDQEIHFLADLIGPRERLVSFVPPHHIFGFLFTVLLPKALYLNVMDLRHMGPGAWQKQITSGDLVVATPYIWGTLNKICDVFPEHVIGVTSTAPMPQDLAHSLEGKGLHNLFEIYGSSETAGVGYRRFNQEAYTLFPYWQKTSKTATETQSLTRTSANGTRENIEINDLLAWEDETHFRVGRRQDNAVQVGGVNVFPSKVQEVLNNHPLISECAVRPKALNGDASHMRLAAFVVLKDLSYDQDKARADIADYCKTHFSAPERPNHLTFGNALPKNEIGKLADWDAL